MNTSRDISNRRPGWIQKPSQQTVPKKEGLPWTVLFLTAAWTGITTLEFMAFVSQTLSSADNGGYGIHPLFFWLASSGAIALGAALAFKKKHGALFWGWLRPLNVFTLTIFVLLGFLSATLYFARLSLQNITEQATGLFEDYGYLRQQIPSPLGEGRSDPWFGPQGKLLPVQQQAWCDRALPLTQLFWQTQQSTGRDTKELAGLLTTGLHSIAYANGCLSAEELLNRKLEVYKSVSEHPSHNQRLASALWWNPIFNQLGKAQAMAVAKLMPTPAGLCVDMASRRQQDITEASRRVIDQCTKAFPEDRQAAPDDLRNIQERIDGWMPNSPA